MMDGCGRPGGKGRIYQVFVLYTPIHICIAPIGTKIGGLVLHAGTNKLLSSHLTNLGISGIFPSLVGTDIVQKKARVFDDLI